MIPFGSQTVTILHREGDGYARYIVSGCSWRQTDAHASDDNMHRATLETVCRLPADGIRPSDGDLFVLGIHDISAENEIGLVRTLDALRRNGIAAFRAVRVADNSTGGPLPHFAASGV